MNIWKFFNAKSLLLFLIILYIIISVVYFFELDFLSTNDSGIVDNQITNKEELYLMKYIDFNNTFFRDKNKIKFLYKAYDSFE